MELKRPQSKRPIPPDAKEVFHGVRFSVYQWEQERFDGTTATYEKLKRHTDSVIMLAKTTEGKYILTHEEQPGRESFISIPAGMMEEGEDPLVAAKRELLEETGYEASDWQFWYADQPNASLDWAEYLFIATGCTKIGEQNLDSGERIEIELASFDLLLQTMIDSKNRVKGLRLLFLEALAFPEKMAELKQKLGEK
jgi:ADP-ribose pyrophosphatase